MQKSETKQILLNYDISTFVQNGEVNLFLGEFLDYNQISVQVDWDSFDALNSEIQLQQRNSKLLKWNDLVGLTTILAQSNDSVIMENFEFLGRELNLKIAWGSVTSGYMSVLVIMKKK